MHNRLLMIQYLEANFNSKFMMHMGSQLSILRSSLFYGGCLDFLFPAGQKGFGWFLK